MVCRYMNSGAEGFPSTPPWLTHRFLSVGRRDIALTRHDAKAYYKFTRCRAIFARIISMLFRVYICQPLSRTLLSVIGTVGAYVELRFFMGRRITKILTSPRPRRCRPTSPARATSSNMLRLFLASKIHANLPDIIMTLLSHYAAFDFSIRRAYRIFPCFADATLLRAMLLDGAR